MLALLGATRGSWVAFLPAQGDQALRKIRAHGMDYCEDTIRKFRCVRRALDKVRSEFD